MKEKALKSNAQRPKTPRGSPTYAASVSDKLDENCPPWTPRAASVAEEEEEELRKVRDSQNINLRHMDPRNLGEFAHLLVVASESRADFVTGIECSSSSMLPASK